MSTSAAAIWRSVSLVPSSPMASASKEAWRIDCRAFSRSREESEREMLERAFRDQERRYNDVARERAALMEEHQRSRAMRTANDARAQISLSDSSRDLEKARQSIRQASYEAEAVGQLGTSDTERQIAAAEVDLKRIDAERELEMMEIEMGLREPEPIEAAPTEESPDGPRAEEGPRG